MKGEAIYNPCDIKVGETVQSCYSGIPYRLIDLKGGMAKMQNLSTGFAEWWNACNNRHFTQDKQLKLFNN